MAGAKAQAMAAPRDQLAARLAVAAPPAGGAWIETARARALARLHASGLPGRRDEYWRFTRPDELNAATPVATAVEAGETAVFAAVEQLKIVFVDGVFDPAASDDLRLAGVEISRLDQAAGADIHWAGDLYGALECAAQTPVARPLAALNTATARAGVLLRVTGRADRPVSLIYRHKSEVSDAMLHHVIRLEAGAELTVLESGAAAARLNAVMEIDLADGASFHHIRAQGRDHGRRAVTHLFARLGARSRFKSFTLTANGVLTRNEVVIDFRGDEAHAHVAGAAMGEGDFHHDDTIFITHDAQGCESRQVFRTVLRNGAVGVFQGKILVRPGAQKTDGYQMSQAMMLDDDSQFLAKPELEIYADDVMCSHGSTTGAIDEEAFFYLRSRGVPARAAQDLLVLAFLTQPLEEIEDAGIAENMRLRLQAWLERRE